MEALFAENMMILLISGITVLLVPVIVYIFSLYRNIVRDR